MCVCRRWHSDISLIFVDESRANSERRRHSERLANRRDVTTATLLVTHVANNILQRKSEEDPPPAYAGCLPPRFGVERVEELSKVKKARTGGGDSIADLTLQLNAGCLI